MIEKLYTIKTASKKSGLNVHTIRAWEKRYQVLSPSRSETNRRLYSENDIKKLTLLKKATCNGYTISSLARLSSEELQKIVYESNFSSQDLKNNKTSEPAIFTAGRIKSETLLDTCLEAISRHDSTGFELMLNKALIALGRQKLIELLIIPLIAKIGELWESGDLRISNEHLASSVLRTFLGAMINNTALPESAPLLVAATLSGQSHELGLLIISVIASMDGWRVNYLGPNLPVEEIIVACSHNSPKVLCLSFVSPADNFRVEKAMKQLKQFLPSGIAVIAGGQAAISYIGILNEINAIHLTDIEAYRSKLREIVISSPF